jgi:putative SOS response-associated peptidase YedK
MPGVFPDYPAPVVRNAATQRGMVTMRWGMSASTGWWFSPEH